MVPTLKISFCSLLLITAVSIPAQVKDVTFKDITGATHTLYNYLNEGKYVIMDFMSEN